MKQLLLITAISFLSLKSRAQNVGIGSNNPSEKLEVAGKVKASDYSYAIPKTRYYTLSGLDFVPEKSTDTTLTGPGSAEITLLTSVPGKRIIAPVNLPDGATMVNMKVYINDFSVADNLQVIFYRKEITSNFFPDNLGFINSAGSIGLAPYETVLYSNVVDNSIYTYYISVGPQDYNSVFPSNAYLRAVIIECSSNATQ